MLRSLTRWAVLGLSAAGFGVSVLFYVGWPWGRLGDYLWVDSFLFGGVLVLGMLTYASRDPSMPSQKPAPAALTGCPRWMLVLLAGFSTFVSFNFSWPRLLSLMPWREPDLQFNDRFLESLCTFGYFFTLAVCYSLLFRRRLCPRLCPASHEVGLLDEACQTCGQHVVEPVPVRLFTPISRFTRTHRLVARTQAHTHTIVIVIIPSAIDSVLGAGAGMLYLCIQLGPLISSWKSMYGYHQFYIGCCLIISFCTAVVCMILWDVLGKETIVLNETHLTTYLEILGMRFGKQHQRLSEVSRLRLDFTPPTERKKTLGKQWTRALSLQRILYEAKGRTLGLGRLLSKDEAVLLLDLLTPGVPASALAPTCR